MLKTGSAIPTQSSNFLKSSHEGNFKNLFKQWLTTVGSVHLDVLRVYNWSWLPYRSWQSVSNIFLPQHVNEQFSIALEPLLKDVWMTSVQSFLNGRWHVIPNCWLFLVKWRKVVWTAWTLKFQTFCRKQEIWWTQGNYQDKKELRGPSIIYIRAVICPY